jgi:hypothetical protein
MLFDPLMGFWIFCIRAGPCQLHRPLQPSSAHAVTESHCLLGAAYFVHVPFVPVSFRFSHVSQTINIVELHVLFVDCEYQALVHLFRFSVRVLTKAASQPPSFPCNFSKRKSLSLFLSIRHSKHSSLAQILLATLTMRKIFPSNMKHRRHALSPPMPCSQEANSQTQAFDQHGVEAGYPLMQRAPVLLATLCANNSKNRFMQLVPSHRLQPPPTNNFDSLN